MALAFHSWLGYHLTGHWCKKHKPYLYICYTLSITITLLSQYPKTTTQYEECPFVNYSHYYLMRCAINVSFIVLQSIPSSSKQDPPFIWCPKGRIGQPVVCNLHSSFNTLRPRPNGRHFVDDIFKCIFLIENVWIQIDILQKFVPKGPINNIPTMV